jgi:hypothetical protein
MGNKIQSIKFKSVDELLDNIPDDEKKLLLYLRKIILDCIPECKEKLAYNVPFYYRHSRICFIWPATIKWGGLEKGVAVGFCNGDKLADEINYLEKGDRKQVYRKIFTSTKEVDIDLLKCYIFEAVDLDESLSRFLHKGLEFHMD